MKITLNEQILAGGNERNENPVHFEIDGQRNVQILKTVRAPHIQTFDRGNLKIRLSFEVGRRHKTQTEAIQHTLTHACKLAQANGSLIIDLEDKQPHRFCLDSATIQHIQTTYKGNASYTTYEIYGGKLHAQ